MSDQLIASLNSQLSDLKASKNKILAKKVDADKRIAELEGLVKSLADERDSFKTQAEKATAELQSATSTLQTQLRTRDHRDAFAQALRDQLHEGVPVEDVWSKIGFDPTKVEQVPTADQIAELVTPARERAGYLFRSADQIGTAPVANPASPGASLNGSIQARVSPTPPPGTGRASSATGGSRVRYSEKETQVPGWERKNPALVAALQAGTADCIDA